MPKHQQPWHDGPVVQLLTPLPLTLASEVMEAVAKVCERHGLEAYFKEADGLGVIHARPIQQSNSDSG